MITATVGSPSLRLPHLSGYWISARFNPANGFQAAFWVGVVVERDASEPLDQAAITRGSPQVGSLQISGECRSYSFSQAELSEIHSFVSRQRCFEALEFRLDFLSRRNPPSASLSNTLEGELAETAALRSSYQFALDNDAAEHLLGLGASRGAAGLVAFRFLSVRNARNGWLPRLVDWDNQVRSDGGAASEIRVKFAQAPSGELVLDAQTAQFIYATERYGLCTGWPLQSLAGLRTGSQPWARLRPPDTDLAQMIDEEEHAGETRPACHRLITTEAADLLLPFGPAAGVAFD